MRADINIFELLKETGSYEETRKKTIEQIESNPNVIYELDVYGGEVDEKMAELLASILYYGKQHGDKVQITGRFLEDEETNLIAEAYRSIDK